MHIRNFQVQDEQAVILLWNKCDLIRSWNDPLKDIQRKLKVNPELFLVGTNDDQIIATIMTGYEGHRGWFNYLAVDPEHQRRGHASTIVQEAERLLHTFGCPKINLQIRTTNQTVIDFYRHLGYKIDDCISMGKRLEHDE